MRGNIHKDALEYMFGKNSDEFWEGMLLNRVHPPVMLPDWTKWQPIETAPRDGSAIWLTWMENGEPMESYVMSWVHICKNGMFPGKVGMWQSPTGAFTWNDDNDGGPTHWRPYYTD